MHPGPAVTDEIRRQLRLGQKARARELLDAALAATPEHPEHLYLRGMLSAGAGDNVSALADFDAALRLMPGLPPLLFNRALVLYSLESVAEALEDLLTLSRSQPGNADVWINIGIIQLRDNRPAEAIDSLLRAQRLAPDSPVVLRTLGNALRDAGRFGESLPLHRRVVQATPNDPAALTDFALCLLSAGEAGQAREHYSRALAVDPGDQTALAGLYMTGNELGDQGSVSQLMDYGALLGGGGETGTEDEIDLAALRALVLAHEKLVWEPTGRSTRLGKQSPMLDLSPGSSFHPLRQMIERQVQQRMQVLAGDPHLQSHPWLKGLPRRWRLQSWITVLEQGGQQAPHIHPAGWLSGVFYVDVGQPGLEHAGSLVFGRMQADLPLQQPAREHLHRPVNGQLITFPSYFFHNTVPYTGTGPRISIAFDVVPQPG